MLGLLVLMSAPARAADTQWIVAIDIREDVIVRAAGLPDGVPLVEAAALAEALNLTLVTGPGEVVVRDGSGRTWYAVDGAPASVDATDTLRFVPCRVQVLNDALYLPLTALAELAGYTSVLDPAGRAFLFPQRALFPVDDRTDPAPPGWTPLVDEKTPAELEETRRLEGLSLERQDTPRTATPVLPPAHAVLQIVAGIGLVTGEDWAAEIDAGGHGGWPSGERRDVHDARAAGPHASAHDASSRAQRGNLGRPVR